MRVIVSVMVSVLFVFMPLLYPTGSRYGSQWSTL